MKLRYLQMASEDATCCVQADPTFVRGWLRKGISHAALGQLTEAKAAFEAGLELDLDNKLLRKQLKLLQQGKTLRPPVVDEPNDAMLCFTTCYGDVGISGDGRHAQGGDEGGIVVCEQSVMSEGAHKACFVMGTDQLVLGVVDADFDFASGMLATNTESGWGFFSDNGKLMNASFAGIAWEGMGGSKAGDEIVMQLDCTAQTLAVSKNGVELGVMCSDVGDDCRGLLWMAQLHDGATVEIRSADPIVDATGTDGGVPAVLDETQLDETPRQERMVGHIWGLESDTGRLLNGKLCKIGRFDEESKRHVCQLLAMSAGRWVTNKYEADKKRVKPSNLRPFHSGLFEAVQASDYAEMVEMLLLCRCAVDTFNKDRSTALIEAARGGAHQCAVFLLMAGANPNMQCLNGMTALMSRVLKETLPPWRFCSSLQNACKYFRTNDLSNNDFFKQRQSLQRPAAPARAASNADPNLRDQQGGTAPSARRPGCSAGSPRLVALRNERVSLTSV